MLGLGWGAMEEGVELVYGIRSQSKTRRPDTSFGHCVFEEFKYVKERTQPVEFEHPNSISSPKWIIQLKKALTTTYLEGLRSTPLPRCAQGMTEVVPKRSQQAPESRNGHC